MDYIALRSYNDGAFHAAVDNAFLGDFFVVLVPCLDLVIPIIAVSVIISRQSEAIVLSWAELSWLLLTE